MANSGIALQRLRQRRESESSVSSLNNPENNESIMQPATSGQTLAGQPLVVNNHSSDSDENDSISTEKPHASTYLSMFAWWKPELIATLLSIASFGSIIAVLQVYNKRIVTELNLPYSLTLNGIVAALATINRACLNTPICSGLMQQMWLYLANESERKGSPRSRLRDIELYADASTGAWGSLLFLCRARLPRLAACVGCVITILSLAYSTFTQQLIAFEPVSTANLTAPGNLPRSESYAQVVREDSPISTYPPLEILSGIYTGMLGGNTRPIQATCPTANCTWPVTPSVAVCGACAESTFEPKGCNTTCPAGDAECADNPNIYCDYSLPSGQSTQLYNFVQEPNDFRGAPGFQLVSSYPGNGSKFNGERDNRAYFMSVELFGLPFGFYIAEGAPRPKELNLTNTECALWMCVQAYNTTVESNIQHDEIVETFDSVNATQYRLNPAPTRNFQLPAVPSSMDPGNLTNFTVSVQAARTLEIFFDGKMRGNVSIAALRTDFSSDLVFGAWNGSTDPSAWINNVATSMTNVMRSTDSVSRDQYHGEQYELIVVIRWKWLILPGALVLTSIVYLLAIMFQTASSSVSGWKASPLTLLLFELDPAISEASFGEVDKQGGIMKAIGDTKIRMMRETGDIRKLHTA